MELGYWSIKGRAEPIRLMLALFKVDYKEVNPKSRKAFKESSKQLGLKFTNLPYLIDGDKKISESTVIPYYIAWKLNKTDFFGKPGSEDVEHRMLMGVLLDMHQVIIEVMFRPDLEVIWEFKKDFMAAKTEELSGFLGSKEFFLGHVTYADLLYFVNYEAGEQLTRALGVPSFFENYANLQALKKRIGELDGIKQYLESDPRAKRIFVPSNLVKPKL